MQNHGEHIRELFRSLARQERETGNWFVGGITNENERTQSITFDFLEEGKTYKAKLYKDGSNAHWNDNPQSYAIEDVELTKESTLDIKLAPGGGFAISIKE